MLRVLRSWPDVVPPGRHGVNDDLDRLIVSNYDYAVALAGVDDDLVLLEWDIQIDAGGLAEFVAAARRQPEQVAVAPYLLHQRSTGLDRPVWAHRRADRSWIATGERFCDLFGFGMVYLPAALLRRYLDEGRWGYGLPHSGCFDSCFSRWHHEMVRRRVPVLWEVRPVHLNPGGADPVCHPSVLSYVTEVLPRERVRGRWVLEVGSYDVNGSARSVLAQHRPADYLGVDLAPGPGVDEVVPCESLAAWAGDTCWDVVVCTEVMEHVRDWQECLRNLLEVVADGGLLLITTRSAGFPYHPFPEDHWRYSVEAMGELVGSAGFDVLDLRPDPDPGSPGVFVLARRPEGWEWPPGKSPAELWAGVIVTAVR